jgi:hypothetical protein
MSESAAPHPAPYGPNTAAVRRFLQRFAALSPAQWEEAAAAFAEIERTRRFATADLALAGAIERLGRDRERDAVVGPILQITRSADGEGGEPHAVAAAALAAALALVARDVLDESDFATLYAPFAPLVWVDAL